MTTIDNKLKEVNNSFKKNIIFLILLVLFILIPMILMAIFISAKTRILFFVLSFILLCLGGWIFIYRFTIYILPLSYTIAFYTHLSHEVSEERQGRVLSAEKEITVFKGIKTIEVELIDKKQKYNVYAVVDENKQCSILVDYYYHFTTRANCIIEIKEVAAYEE